MAGQALSWSSDAFPATLSASAGASGSVQVTSLPGTWPSVPFKCLVDWGLSTQEAMIVTSVSGSGPVTLTGTRGADGTTAQAHASGAVVYHGFTAEEFAAPAALGTSVYNVRDPKFGGKGTAQQVTDGAMTSGLATLACTTSTPFTAANVGQVIVVQKAGAAGADLVTTIAAFTDTGHVTLSASAGSAVTGATTTFGPDDTAACQAATTAAQNAGGASVYYPAGAYLTTSSVAATSVGNGTQAYGDGLGTQIIVTGSYDALSWTNGTGLTVRDMQVTSALSAPAAGAALSINSVADYRVLNVSSYGTYFGGHTTGGTSKTSNWVNCYIQAAFAGFYAEGSFLLMASHFGGGTYGAIMNSSGGHSARMVRVGLYGPLSLTTWNTGLGANPNKTVWLEAVECNYQAGTNPPEGPGGMNLANCAGDVHLGQCWLAGSGTLIGGGPGATGGRTDTNCTTTAGSTTVLDSHITSGDNGSAVIGFGIPPGTTISSVTAGTSFVMSNAALYSVSLTVNVGGTSSPNVPTWVDITGGIYSGNNLTMQNGISLVQATEVTVTGAHLTGSADHTLYDDISIASACTGPIAITGCEFSGNSRYNITSAVTSGPVSITGNAFAGFSGGHPVNITGSLAAHTIINGGYPSTLPGSLTTAMTTLTDAATIAVNAGLGNGFRVTLGGNRTLGTPANPTDGQKITVSVTQDATGSRTLAFSSAYVFSTGQPSPSLSTGAGNTDVLAFIYDAGISAWRYAGGLIGFAT